MPLTIRLSNEQFHEPPEEHAGCVRDTVHQRLQLVVAGSQQGTYSLLPASTVQLPVDKVTKQHHTLQILEGRQEIMEFHDLTFNKSRGRTGEHCWGGGGEGEGRGREREKRTLSSQCLDFV